MVPPSKYGQRARPDERPRRKLPLPSPEAGQGDLRAGCGDEPPGHHPAPDTAAGLRGQDGPGRNGREARARRAPFFAVIALSLLVSTACGAAGGGGTSTVDAGAEQEAGGQNSTAAPKIGASEEPRVAERGKAEARDDATRADKVGTGAGKAGASAGEARADSGSVAVAGTISGGDTGDVDAPRKVTLRLTGDPKTEFSGACSVRQTEKALNGRVPERYVFEPRGERLECELRAQGGGALGMLVTDGAGVRSEQRITAGERTLQFAYSRGSISSSTSVSSEDRSVTYSGGSS